MDSLWVRPCRWAGWLLLLGLAVPPVRGDIIPLLVKQGQCEWVLPAGHGPYFVIVGSLAGPAKTFPVQFRTETSNALPSKFAGNPPGAFNTASFETARRVERLARLRQVPDIYPPLAEPPRHKTFYLFTGERDLENPLHYTPVHAELKGVGKYVQIYLDRQDLLLPFPGRGEGKVKEELDQAITEVIHTFDQEIYPWSLQKLGRVVDIDRDGRFTVFFSSRLGRLQEGKVSLDGFVRGSDFIRDLASPFGNRCDMMYLNAGLRPGPHLRTVLAHEFTHAVTFSEHALNNPPGACQDEESWLSEGLAHLVEDLHQHGWSNLDYRLNAYLCQPERYPLVVPDYFGTGLWRAPGPRGSAFLFLRWCYQLTGPDLLPRLVQSPLVGVANLEHATGKSMPELFRTWAVSLIRDNSWRVDQPLQEHLHRPKDNLLQRGKEPSQPSLANPHLPPSPLGSPVFPFWLCGPQFFALEQGGHDFNLVGTGIKFLLVPGNEKRNRRIQIHADRDSQLQVTLVGLEPNQGIITLTCQSQPTSQTLLLEVKAHGNPVQLEWLSWGKLYPTGPDRDETGYRNLSACPEGSLVPAGEKRVFSLPGIPSSYQAHDLAIRVRGRDTENHTVIGWSLLTGRQGERGTR